MRNFDYDAGYTRGGPRVNYDHDGPDELTPAVVIRLRRFRRRQRWQRRLTVVLRSVELAAMLLALGAVTSVSLPARSAQLGTGWVARIVAGRFAAGNALSRQAFAGAHIAFSGKLLPSARHAIVTLVLQRTGGGSATTVGTTMLRAGRVFNTQPAPLAALFSDLGVTARAGNSYRIAVESGSATLTSATVTLAR